MASMIRAWLADHGLEKYASAFEDDEVDIEVLPELTEDDLKSLGLPLGPRKKLLRALAGLSGKAATPGSGAVEAAVMPELAPESGHDGGERRQVTVLFADLSGFTSLSSDLGAEATHELLGQYFAAADGVIESYGGTVDKHIGDSVMAVFGAPVAHTNDPERAIRAALDIQAAIPSIGQRVGRALKVHIGVASGQVVASGVSGSEQFTVTGSSVNLASRLTDAAGPGETLISPTVHSTVAGLVESDDRGLVPLKGIDAPVRLFLLRGLRDDGAGEASRPFVGRRAELQQFGAALATCQETGTGQVIYLRGEAGIGKTRLNEECERLARNRGFDCHRALVLDFGVGRGQDAIGGLLRRMLALPSQSDEASRAAVAQAVLSEGLLDRGQAMFLHDLLDVPQPLELRSLYDAMDNTRRNRGKRETMAALVVALSRRRPLFLTIEDVHWADNVTLDHLVELMGTASDQPVIIVMTSRIEGDPLDPSRRSAIAGTPFVTIDLRPLRRQDSLALAAEFFDTTNKFAQSCIERAEGNPLFLEQLLRSAEATADDRVPGSVQSIVHTRMDALEPRNKQALLTASVLGQRFSLDALRHVMGDPQFTCEGLIARYFVRPEGNDFLFAHALVREGVYNSLLSSRRTELHRAAAAWYAESDPVLRAEHLDRANDSEAAQAYLDAAAAEAKVLQFERALTLSERGIALADDAAVRCALMCLRGETLRNTGATEASIAAFEAALEEAQDGVQCCHAWIGLAGGLRIADRQQSALEILDKAQSVADDNDLLAALAQIHHLRGNLYFPLGNIDGCLAEHERALEYARKVGSTEGEALALGGLGDAYYLRGHMRTARDQFQACIDVCQSHGFGRIEVANRHMVGWARIHLMEFDEALEDANACIGLARQVSHHRAEVLGLTLVGHIEMIRGNTERAREHFEASLSLSRTIGAQNLETQSLTRLAQIYASEGRGGDARKCAQQAIDLLDTTGVTFFGPVALAAWASLADDEQARRDALGKARDILQSGCVSHNQIWFAECAIGQMLEHGDWDAAEACGDLLGSYTREQPLEWPSFLIRFAHDVAAWGRGDRSASRLRSLAELKDMADERRLQLVLPMLERALGTTAAE